MIRALAVAAVLALLPLAAQAQAADPAVIAAGMALYKPAPGGANCELCHGWNGMGRYHDTPFSPATAGGPGLVGSKMTRAEMTEILTCGKYELGLVMPRYRNEAWTAAIPCHGKTKADITPEELPVIGEMQLTPAQIDTLITYITAVYPAGGMSHDNCTKYWTTPATQKVCDIK